MCLDCDTWRSQQAGILEPCGICWPQSKMEHRSHPKLTQINEADSICELASCLVCVRVSRFSFAYLLCLHVCVCLCVCMCAREWWCSFLCAPAEEDHRHHRVLHMELVHTCASVYIILYCFILCYTMLSHFIRYCLIVSYCRTWYYFIYIANWCYIDMYCVIFTLPRYIWALCHEPWTIKHWSSIS